MRTNYQGFGLKARLDIIEQMDPGIRAWAYFDRNQVGDQLDTQSDTGTPLSGLPVGLKDVIDTRDMPTENGTVLDKGRRPEKDAVLVSHLRAAGGIVMGKTVSSELAYFYPGKTCNPHDLRRTPGGSSSGSAAAVAAGMVPLAVGTQTTGSVIRPASFCGVVGFKPTLGLIPVEGVLLQSHTLDTVGVFAKSVSDAANLAACLSDSDVQADLPTSPPRFAYVRSPYWDLAEPATQSTFDAFADQLGAQCQPVALPPAFDAARNLHKTINLFEMAHYYGEYERRGRDRLSAQMCEAIDTGRLISEPDYQDALTSRSQLIELLNPIFSDFEAILTPATLGEAPIGLDTTGDPAFCALWSLCGVPAISLPLLTGPAGMPLGVQLVGPRGGDNTLLASARWLMENPPVQALS